MGVRREAVRLELQDAGFTSGMARDAAAVALLKRELNDLDGTSVRIQRTMPATTRQVGTLGRESGKAGADIDKLSGRMRILADLALALGPALIPVAAVGVPAISGLASQLGFAAIGAGIMVTAFQGMGDALEAVNDYALEPTAANLEKAQKALKNLSPAARDFVAQIQQMRPAFQELRKVASEGLFPGVVEGLDAFEAALPALEEIVRATSTELGEIAADTGRSFASERWAPFFAFVADEAPDALRNLATALGNTTHAAAGMWMAFDPLNDDFSQWLVDISGQLDRWATGLGQTEDFQEFLAYVRENGPELAETVGAIGNAFLQIAEAASPVAGPVLDTLEAFADAIAAIADSPLGTPIMAAVTAIGFLNTALRLTNTLSLQSFGGPALARAKTIGGAYRGLGAQLQVLARNYATAGAASERMAKQNQAAMGQVRTAVGGTAKAAAGVAGIALLASGAADGLGLTNTATLTLAGSLAGPLGAAAGAAVGYLLDMTGGADDARQAVADLQEQFENAPDMSAQRDIIRATREEIEKLEEKRSGLSGLTFNEADATKLFELQRVLPELEKGFGKTTSASRSFGVAQVDLKRVLEETRDQARKQATQWLAFGDNVKDAEVSLGDFLKSMEEQARALEEFTSNARRAGERGLKQGLIDKLEELGPAGALRMKQLANASDKEIKRANDAFDRGVRAMRKYEEFQISPKSLNVNPKPAERTVAETLRWIRAQRPVLEVDVRINRAIIRNTNGVVSVNGVPMADGGTVPGQRRPYGDRTLVLAAPGEEIITNRRGEADRFRADRAAGRIPAYADGGTVGWRPQAQDFAAAFQRHPVVAPSIARMGMGIDYGRVADAVASDRLLGYRNNRDALLSALRTALREVPIVQAPRDTLLLHGAV